VLKLDADDAVSDPPINEGQSISNLANNEITCQNDAAIEMDAI
jgi:hypothetical protein